MKQEKILITGGTGFLGKSLTKTLVMAGYYETYPVGRNVSNLLDQIDTIGLLEKVKPDIIIHLAARVGGILANQKNPYRFWLENSAMGINLLRACEIYRPKKIIIVCTTCAYPKHCPTPFKEDDIWNGYPEETNAPYAVAKKALMLGAMQFEKETGIAVRCPIPTNLYGPGDHYGTDSNHVIPALIEKYHKARVNGNEEVILWGDGSPTRDFLHVNDASSGIMYIMEKADKCEPINLGSGCEISISEIAEIISEIVGFEGETKWDTSRPNGQPQRVLDTSRIEKLGWKPKIDLIEGLRETYQDYMQRFHL